MPQRIVDVVLIFKQVLSEAGLLMSGRQRTYLKCGSRTNQVLTGTSFYLMHSAPFSAELTMFFLSSACATLISRTTACTPVR